MHIGWKDDLTVETNDPHKYALKLRGFPLTSLTNTVGHLWESNFWLLSMAERLIQFSNGNHWTTMSWPLLSPFWQSGNRSDVSKTNLWLSLMNIRYLMTRMVGVCWGHLVLSDPACNRSKDTVSLYCIAQFRSCNICFASDFICPNWVLLPTNINPDMQLSCCQKKRKRPITLNFFTVLFSFLWHCFEKKKEEISWLAEKLHACNSY